MSKQQETKKSNIMMNMKHEPDIHSFVHLLIRSLENTQARAHTQYTYIQTDRQREGEKRGRWVFQEKMEWRDQTEYALNNL